MSDISNRIDEILNTTLSNLKQMIDTSNVIGAPIIISENVKLVPISKVSYGYVGGGGEYSETNPKLKLESLPYAGITGGGVNITPIGFLCCEGEHIRLLTLEEVKDNNKWFQLIQSAIDVVKK